MAKDKDDYPLTKAEITRHQAYLQQTILYLEQNDMAKNWLINILYNITGQHQQKDEVLLPRNTQDTTPQIKEIPVEKIIYKDKIVEKVVYQDKIVEKRVEVPVDRIVEKRIEVTPQWAKSLESEFTFLKQVQSHPELVSILLPNRDDNVLQLITIASQWNNVLRVWDAIATQIKNTQQAISTTEQQILEHSLALFNLTLQSNQATLKNPETGESYDYDIHQKVSGSGGSVEQVLLAGLYNAAGENVRAAIVTTR
ncbi:hypothetical protein [Acinetobacter junii]|uniref:hypothetical protein n=1 Tax=Acinetobacter junii TaxID=40215 RepID=UPI001C06AC9F|nr:hypothetical protein [Acinetobacter junii]